MYLVKPCPACLRMLRFPIDRGRLRVRCLCGESFIADPDDVSLYTDAKFDISNKKRMHGISPGKLLKLGFRALIQKMYEFRYQVQNLPLLTGKERIKTIMILFLLAAFIFIIAYALCVSESVPSGDGWVV